MEDFEKIESIISKYLEEEGEDEDEYFSGSASEEKVNEAEQFLKVKFPKSYKYFLERYGSGGIGSADFFGIEEEEVEKFTVVSITELYRNKINLPKELIVIENCGDYVVCLDTSDRKDSDCTVVTYGVYDKDGKVQCAERFYDYLIEKLDDALN